MFVKLIYFGITTIAVKAQGNHRKHAFLYNVSLAWISYYRTVTFPYVEFNFVYLIAMVTGSCWLSCDFELQDVTGRDKDTRKSFDP